ncbi:3-hydroxyacyl-CoA dehydrogenase family protein [Blastococcus sp. SYSU D00669]
MNDIRAVGVLGFGTMGAGIVQVAAAAGCDVVVYEPEQAGLDAGFERLSRFVEAGVTRGKLTTEARDELLSRVVGTAALDDVSGVDLVVEAVVEDLGVKRELLGALAEGLPPTTVIATNTSALSVTQIAASLPHPGRVAGLHFFNPAPVMALVEVVRALQTSDGTVERLMAWSTAAGKEPIVVDDRPGFLVNSLFMPYVNDVVQAYDDGLASAQDIDTALRLGLGYPMGPLELLDLIGIDTHLHATSAAYADTLEPRFAPPPLLARLVQAGWTGDKAGRGIRDLETRA